MSLKDLSVRLVHIHTYCKITCQSATFDLLLQISRVSGRVLEMIFNKWDFQGILQCSSQNNSSHSVYVVQTTGEKQALSLPHMQTDAHNFPEHRAVYWFLFAEAGFLGPVSGLPKELLQLFPEDINSDFQSSAGLYHLWKLINFADGVLLLTIMKFPCCCLI